MLYYPLSALVNCVASLLLGVFVYFKRSSRVNRLFVFYTVGMVVWTLNYFLWQISGTQEEALLYCKLLMIGAMLIPVAYLHFITVFLDVYDRYKYVLWIGYAVFAASFILDVSGGFIVSAVRSKMGFRFWPDAGPALVYFLIYFFVYAWLSVWLMLKQYSVRKGLKRNQLRFLLVGTVVGFLGGATNYPLWYDIPVLPFGNACITFYVVLISYAITRHRLMDISIVIRKTILYIMLLIGLVFVSVAMAYIIHIRLPVTNMKEQMAVYFGMSLFLSFVAIFFVPRLKTKAESVIGYALFKDKYKYQDVLLDFSKNLVFIPGKEELFSKMAQVILESIQPYLVVVATVAHPKEIYEVKAVRKSALFKGESIQPDAVIDLPYLIKELSRRKKSIIMDELVEMSDTQTSHALAEEMQAADFQLLVPMLTENNLIGFICLGPKVSGEMYYQGEVNLLESIAAEAAFSLTYRNMENQMFQQNKLMALGTLAAGMAHEIKNPLVSIQIFAQLLPEKFDDIEFRQTFAQVVERDVQRVKKLIDNVLAFASNKEVQLKECDMVHIIEDTIFLVDPQLDRNRVALITDVPENPVWVLGSEDQLKQVFINLIINAIESIEGNGSVTIRMKKVRTQNSVEIEFEDTGCGMDEETQAKIFDLFYTTKEKGVGLGLGISFKIIQAHNATIDVVSKEGQGTRFILRFPTITPAKQAAGGTGTVLRT